jgi:hypothetical protein
LNERARKIRARFVLDEAFATAKSDTGNGKDSG